MLAVVWHEGIAPFTEHVDPRKRWLGLANGAVAAPCFVQALGLQRSPLRLRDPVAGGAAEGVRGVG